MKHLLSLLVGAVLVALAWFATFGNPFGPAGGGGDAPAASGPRGGGGRGGGATVVTVSEVAVEPYLDLFRSVGTARAKASVTVETEAAGKVTAVHFGANQAIATGAPLISLDDALERIALRSAEASLAQARATLARYRALQKSNSGVVSAVSVTEAETQVEIGEADLARAEYDLAQKTVRAPISGTLGLTDVEPGVYLVTGAEIVTITDQSSLTIEFGLPDRAVGALAVGQPVRLTTVSLPGRVFDGVVEGFDGRIDSTTRTIKVRARVDNAGGLMLPGMIFNVVLSHDNAPLPRVPANAITWGRDGASVWVIEDGKVRPVSVAIRHRQSDTVWLEADLADGTPVVVEGVQKLRPGAEVNPAPPDAGPRAAAASDTQRAPGAAAPEVTN